MKSLDGLIGEIIELFYFWGLNGCLASLEVYFLSKFSDKKMKGYQYISYLVLMYIIYKMEIWLQLPFLMTTLLEIGALFIFGGMVLKCQMMQSAIGTVLAITIMQIINGVFRSVCGILTRFHVPWAFSFLMTIIGIAAVYLAYRYILRLFQSEKLPMTRYVLLLILPVFFILLVIQYMIILFADEAGQEIGGTYFGMTFNMFIILLIQVVAFFCLLAVVFAYVKLSEGFVVQMKNALLEQQAGSQKDYIEEIQRRYEETRAFRHDVKNHYTVLYELLKKQEIESALAYLKKIQFASENLSLPYQTGNTVIDMLVGNKLGLASQLGIETECTIKLCKQGEIDDLDLCIVLANGIDNAINACKMMKEKQKYLKLSATQKGSFLMIEIENSLECASAETVEFGIGLNNIRAVAEKYNGTMEIENTVDYFRLSVLLVISLHSKSI